MESNKDQGEPEVFTNQDQGEPEVFTNTQFGQIKFSIWTNQIFNLEKYYL